MQDDVTVKVWDPFIRAFHWTLVGAFAIAFLTEDDFITLHSWAGYVVGTLLTLRLVWGFVGPTNARFSSFVFSPRIVLLYLKDTVALRAKRYLGHNPAGGAMIVVLMVSLSLTTITGLILLGAAENAGPLASWFGGANESSAELLEEIHEAIANFTLLLVVVHVGGVIVGSILHRENLVRAMFDGTKRATTTE